MSDPSHDLTRIFSLSCEQLVEFLEENGFASEVCQTFKDQDVDGESFMELSEGNFEKLFPNKMGIVKKLIRFQQTGTSTSRSRLSLPNEENKLDDSTDKVTKPAISPRPKPRTIKSSSLLPEMQNASTSPTSSYPEGSIKKRISHLEDFAQKPQPFSYLHPPTKDTRITKFTSPDEIDVSTLDCDEFAEWLKAKRFSSQHCKAFKEHNVTGKTFLELKKDDLKEIVNQIGTVAELQSIQKQLDDSTKVQPVPPHKPARRFTEDTKRVPAGATPIFPVPVTSHQTLTMKISETQKPSLIPQNSINDDDLVPDVPSSETKAFFSEYLNLLGLTNKFPKKLTLQNAMVIRKEALGSINDTDKMETLPYLILQKIMMFDARSRASLFTGEIHGSSLLENHEIHPLDSFITLLHCCNNFLTQDVLTRLSTCQLAIPFLMPNPYDGSVMYHLWGMREIVRAWKSTNSEGALISNEGRIVDYPGPVVSFYKIGKLHQSKSKIINEVISESRVDFFFNWDCEGGTSNQLFVDGMAELCCYLPSGKKDVNDFYSDIIIFTNLRGDPRKHVKQLNFMHKISFMSFVLLQEKDLDSESLELLEKLAKSPGGVVVMLADLSQSQESKNQKLQQIDSMEIIKLKRKNYAQIRNEVRKQMVSKLSTSTQEHHKKLSKCVEIARSFGIQIDEDDEGCKDGEKLAKEVMQQIWLLSAHEAKLKMLPLQGPDLWHKWASLDKEFYRQLARNKSIDVYSKDMETKKKAVRQNQFNFTVKPTPVMKTFLSNLLNHTGNVRLYFLHWLKMLLDDHSRDVLPSLNNAYQKTRADLVKAKAENKNQQEDSEIVLQLKDKLKLQNEQLVNASFGLEHFFREMGQMYEARMDAQFKRVSKDLKNEVSCFPQVVADLMNEGYPVELMDGDAAHVPVTWVSAVINRLKDQHSQKQNIFVISVLGIQSTGKSTLLNTIFGLRFNVSAGRCTRGAYFQLLSFNSELSKELDCDHILIVDTEGLRAPELQYKESQKHDNELATFVIGLADLTIINIYGETPGELTDILQTAVHAFIRMKNVEMQLSCHFVHQNVTAVMAESKSKVGRQNFQDRLDLMTKTAAKIEKCEGRYRSFQDVIQFNDETNVTLFPSLWKGDPPMAPVNPGYSFKASTLKKAVMISVKDKDIHCSFASFQLRVKTLWDAVLQEKFVFSFKNTLEVTAYNELDTKYSKWSWDLQHNILEWQRQTGNQISSCDVSEIDSVVDKCLLEVGKDLDKIYGKLYEELVEFFEKSERSETLAQWRKSTEVRLKNLCEEHKDDARKHCNMLRQNREGRVKIDNIQQTYRQQLQAQIVALASDTKNAELTADKREEIFNTQWQRWIRELSHSNKPVAYATPVQMEMEITRLLEKKYTSHSHLVVQALHVKALKERSTLKLQITRNHLDSTRWVNNMTKHAKNLKAIVGVSKHKHYAEVNEEDLHFARAQTDDLFLKVEERMENIMESCQDFNKGLISSLLKEAQEFINKFNDGKNSFTFTPHYQVDIAITISGYAYQKFIAKVQQLAYENDPVHAMNRLKPLFFRTFETQFSEASNDQTAAQNLCNILTKSIEKALIEKLQIEIVNNMKLESSNFRKKNYFKVMVMKDLAATKDFKLFTEYLRNIAVSLKYWSRIYVRRYCEAKNSSGNINLFDLAKENLNIIIAEITEVIKEMGNFIENIEITDTASSISDEDTGPPEDSTQHLDVKEWLENFHENAKKIIVIDLQEIMVMVGVKSIHNLTFFTKLLIKNLKSESETVLNGFKRTHASIAKLCESSNSPHILLFNSLIGCKEQCPFCKEQCELTDENHLESKKPHYTEIHRPKCLGGYTYVKNNKLVFDTCIQAIDNDTSFRNSDTNQEDHPYKEYKKIYPKWQISSESPKTGPKYWEWFIATNLSELIEWNEAEQTSLEDRGWEDITEEDAIDNLTVTYGLNVDPD